MQDSTPARCGARVSFGAAAGKVSPTAPVWITLRRPAPRGREPPGSVDSRGAVDNSLTRRGSSGADDGAPVRGAEVPVEAEAEAEARRTWMWMWRRTWMCHADAARGFGCWPGATDGASAAARGCRPGAVPVRHDAVGLNCRTERNRPRVVAPACWGIRPLPSGFSTACPSGTSQPHRNAPGQREHRPSTPPRHRRRVVQHRPHHGVRRAEQRTLGAQPGDGHRAGWSGRAAGEFGLQGWQQPRS